MVDRLARNKALTALRRFLRCETTNCEYELEYPLSKRESNDPAIEAISTVSWSWSDDFREHKLEGKYELSPEEKEFAERCCLLLASNFEYKWRETNFIRTNGISSGHLTTLGLVQTLQSADEMFVSHLDQPEGDASVWPFFQRDEFIAAQQTHEVVKGN